MDYHVEFTPAAKRQLKKLPKDAKRRIVAVVELLRTSPRPPNAKKLKGKIKGLHRIKTGNYRVIYQIQKQRLVICVVAIGDRKDSTEDNPPLTRPSS